MYTILNIEAEMGNVNQYILHTSFKKDRMIPVFSGGAQICLTLLSELLMYHQENMSV